MQAVPRALRRVITHLEPARRLPFPLILVLLAVLVVLTVTAAVTVGPVRIDALTVWGIVGARTIAWPTNIGWTLPEEQIVWQIRLPRALLGCLVGSGLAVVGVTLQALVRNSLADPYLLGVSSGAAVGATAVILFGALSSFGANALPVGAFLGALVAVAAVFALAQSGGRITPLRLVLSGTAVGYAFSAISSLMVFKAEQNQAVRSVLFWLMGSLGAAKWTQLPLPTVVLAILMAVLMSQSRQLNALAMGDDTATTLGINVTQLRRALFVVTSLLTGVMVALSGSIGFVGLVIPHVARMAVGADHRRTLPVAALVGAAFLVWVDVLARTVAAPVELPLGIVTGLLGAPVFAILMRRRAYRFGGTG